MKKMNMSLFFLAMLLQAQNEVCLEIEQNPNADDDAFDCFTKYVNVLDCFEVYAESSIPDYKVLHVAAVAAELLDNDEDGVVDDEALFYELQSMQALMPVFSYDGNACMDNFMDNYDGDGVSAVLWRNEIDPSQPGHWGDDATVEEVLHTINHVGHVSIYPNVFGLAPNSSIMSDAMDIARGGQFIQVPNNYPEEAWYHYDDYTCDYECMAIEYLYWCIVTDMGILDDPQTCAGIANEWEPCSPELFESTDIIMHGVVNNSSYTLPQLAPDGNYCPDDVLELTITYNSDWNLVGLPLQVDGASYTILFPESIEGTLYSFDDGYTLEISLIQGEGYWLRFANAGSTTIDGTLINTLTISLNEGWNLITGISSPVAVESISDPGGIIVSGTIYGYSSSYYNADAIEPGKGYWINASADGDVTFGDGVARSRPVFEDMTAGANTLTIDGQDLCFGIDIPADKMMSYSLPPKPPPGAFDVRFSGDTRIGGKNSEIEVMSPYETITISYDVVLDAGEYMHWVLTSESGDEYILEEDGEITVPTEDTFTLARVPVIPIAYALHQNYPNPFNPITTLRYDLPVDNHVTIIIYDLSGREVNRIVNASQPAGHHSVMWNSTNSFGKPVSAGVYLYQIRAGDFVQTRKMVLLK